MFLSLILPLYSRFSWTCSRFPSREFNQRLFCAPNKAAVRVIRCKLKGQSLTEAAEPLPDKEEKKARLCLPHVLNIEILTCGTSVGYTRGTANSN